MTAREYKVTIGILLVTNVACLIIISILCGEIDLLQNKLSEMSDTIRVLDDKIASIEAAQEKFQNESIQSEKVAAKGSKYIFGGILTILGIAIVAYFGGIDPGNLGKIINLSADQSTADLISQNDLIGKNLKLCLQGIDFMNKSIVAEIGAKTDFVCAKLEVITKAFINKDVNLNSVLGNLPSDKGKDWE